MYLKKRYIILVGIIFSIFLLISSATAVQQIHSRPLIKKLNEREHIKHYMEKWKLYNIIGKKRLKKKPIWPLLPQDIHQQLLFVPCHVLQNDRVAVSFLMVR